MSQIEELHRLSPQISFAYKQIGKLELSLRNIIPITLSNLKSCQKNQEWPKTILLDLRSSDVLARAVEKNSINPEDFLPFSFWRFLFSKKNYGSLWVPKLHRCFPNLENATSFTSFKEIDHAMDSTLRLRNNIAHYQINKLKNIRFSVKNVTWLLSQIEDI
jgi:hypothetical protein